MTHGEENGVNSGVSSLAGLKIKNLPLWEALKGAA
jgi:hypothetical protein